MKVFAESSVAGTVVPLLDAIVYRVAQAPEIAPDMPTTDRAIYGDVV